MDCKDIPTIQKPVLLDKLSAPGRFSKQAIAQYFMTNSFHKNPKYVD